MTLLAAFYGKGILLLWYRTGISLPLPQASKNVTGSIAEIVLKVLVFMVILLLLLYLDSAIVSIRCKASKTPPL